jgi:hypothetical protein
MQRKNVSETYSKDISNIADFWYQLAIVLSILLAQASFAKPRKKWLSLLSGDVIAKALKP